jgi:hypothetical protein
MPFEEIFSLRGFCYVCIAFVLWEESMCDSSSFLLYVSILFRQVLRKNFGQRMDSWIDFVLLRPCGEIEYSRKGVAQVVTYGKSACRELRATI